MRSDVKASAARNPLLGDVLVVLAQLLAATQFIVEEKYLAKCAGTTTVFPNTIKIAFSSEQQAVKVSSEDEAIAG